VGDRKKEAYETVVEARGSSDKLGITSFGFINSNAGVNLARLCRLEKFRHKWRLRIFRAGNVSWHHLLELSQYVLYSKTIHNRYVMMRERNNVCYALLTDLGRLIY
jgi:hypothetical protein